MTTFTRWSPTSARLAPARLDRRARKYDLRVVDQFYGYCTAVARAHRHRTEAQVQSQLATRRHLATLVVAGGILCYYLLERFPQVLSVL